ncbi:MAG: hypothetical protein P8176_11855, partial [Gammaproteobacteria bacterium]
LHLCRDRSSGSAVRLIESEPRPTTQSTVQSISRPAVELVAPTVSQLPRIEEKCCVCAQAMRLTNAQNEVQLMVNEREGIHAACLFDTFLREADNNFNYVSQVSLTQRLTLALVRSAVERTGKEAIPVMIQFLGRALTQRQNNLPTHQEITLLTYLSEFIAKTEDTSLVSVGARRLSHVGAAVLALEKALHYHEASLIQLASRQLLQVTPVDFRLTLFGFDFPRERVQAWANGVDIPEVVSQCQGIVEQYYEKLAINNEQNVHDDTTKIYIASLYHTMVERVEKQESQVMSVEQVRTDLTTALRRDYRNSEAVQQTINDFLDRDEQLSILPIVPQVVLTTAWTYAKHVAEPAIRERLQEALLDRLCELAVHRTGNNFGICSLGRISQLIDFSSGVDFSFHTIDLEAVKAEIQSLASGVSEAVHNEFEVEIEMIARDSMPDSPEREALNHTLTTIMRDRFKEKAHLELSVLRGVSSVLVAEETSRVFPVDYVEDFF